MRISDNSAEYLPALGLGRMFLHEDQRRCPIVQAGCIAGRNGSIAGKRRAQNRQTFQRGIKANMFILSKTVIPFFPGTLTGTI